MKSPIKLFLCLLFFNHCLNAQTDLLEAIDYQDSSQGVSAAFKSLKVVNFESTKLVSAKELSFSVSHRFGSIKYGFDNFFGLDDAVTRLNFIYGLNSFSNISFSRTSYKKIFDLGFKSRLIKQSENFPFTLVYYCSITLDSSLEKEVYPTLSFSNRMGYFNQLIISKKFNNALSLLFSPTIFHENTVVFDQQENTQYALSLGGRYKVSKRTSINIDYGYHFNRADASIFNNPLGIGVDIETGGHVFQLLFSNSQPMNSINAMTAAAGDWSDGDVYFGFNLFRTF
tara:strand:+ start:413 stop:1264 length:852 start_codon:yes stop_codon:yes gene_type:complete